jgi:riboflavin biosynthesis pyrimidine reductase
VTRSGTGLAHHRALIESPSRPIVLASGAGGVDRGLADIAEIVPLDEGDEGLIAALETLRRKGLAHILCEGGPRLLGALFHTGAVDELCLTLAPQLTGAPSTPLHDTVLPAPVKLSLENTLVTADMLLLRYRVRQRGDQDSGE